MISPRLRTTISGLVHLIVFTLLRYLPVTDSAGPIFPRVFLVFKQIAARNMIPSEIATTINSTTPLAAGGANDLAAHAGPTLESDMAPEGFISK